MHRLLGETPLIRISNWLLCAIAAGFPFLIAWVVLEASLSGIEHSVAHKLDLASRTLEASPLLKTNAEYLAEFYHPRPIIVEKNRTLFDLAGAGARDPLPDQCYVRYEKSKQSPQSIEVCAAVPQDTLPFLFIAINYCAIRPPTFHVEGREIRDATYVQLEVFSKRSDRESKKWTLVYDPPKAPVAAGSPDLGQTGVSAYRDNWMPKGYHQTNDRELSGRLWPDVPVSDACPGFPSGTTLQRIRLRLNPSCGPPTEYDYCSDVNWARDLGVRVRIYDPPQQLLASTFGVDANGHVSDFEGQPRLDPWRSFKGVLDKGEVLTFGLGSKSKCAAHELRSPADLASTYFSVESTSDKAPQIDGPENGTASVFSRAIAQAITNYSVALRALETNCLAIARDNGNSGENIPTKEPDSYVFIYTRPRAENVAILASIIARVMPVSIAAILLVLAVSVWITTRLGRPIRKLANQLRMQHQRSKIADASDILYLNARNEVGSVARAFADLIKKIVQGVSIEQRFVSQQRDINNIIAHEINSPVHELSKELPSHPTVDRIISALRAISQIDSIYKHELAPDRHSIVDLNSYLAKICAADSEHGPIVFTACNQPSLAVSRGDLIWLTLANILRNAARFRDPPDSAIEVTLTQEDGMNCISVRNAGPMIQTEKYERIFQLGYSEDVSGGMSRRTSANKGIGLFVARHYARLLGGEIRVVTCSAGAEFVIALPIVPKAPSQAEVILGDG